MEHTPQDQLGHLQGVTKLIMMIEKGKINNKANHLHSYQVVPILASTYSSTSRSFSKGWDIEFLTISNAR